MKVYKEMNCYAVYDAMSGQERETANYFSFSEISEILNVLEEGYPDGIDESDLFDLFRFESDWLARLVGYKDFEEVMEARPNGAVYLD